MGAGVLDTSRSQRRISTGDAEPASSLRCRSAAPACPRIGGAVSPPRSAAVPGAGEGEAALCGLGWLNGGERDAVLSSLPCGGCSGQPWLRGAGMGGRVCATAALPGGLHGVLSSTLGASGSQGGQRGVGGRQDKRGGLRDGSPALSSLWDRHR